MGNHASRDMSGPFFFLPSFSAGLRRIALSNPPCIDNLSFRHMHGRHYSASGTRSAIMGIRDLEQVEEEQESNGEHAESLSGFVHGYFLPAIVPYSGVFVVRVF